MYYIQLYNNNTLTYLYHKYYNFKIISYVFIIHYHINKMIRYISYFQNSIIREVWGANAPLLLAPAEGWDPLGPAGGLRPQALELKVIPTLILW